MKKFLLLLTFLLASFSMVKAVELTVADGTSGTSNVPAYGLYADTQGARAQCLYPSDLLTEMVGGQISQITFYLTTPAAEAWTGTFQFSLGTTETATLSGFIDDDLTAVYTGTMDASGATMTVEFANPFTYTGGNLIVDWYVTTAGNYKSATFTAMALSGAGRYRSSASGSGSAANYLPKATFEYTAGSVGPTCDKPNVPVVSAITATSATIAWDGGSGTYNVEYKEASAPDTAWISLLAGTTALSAPLADLSPATDYKVRVQSYCSELDTVSRWSSASFTTYNELPLDQPFTSTTIPAGWQRYTGLLRSVLNDTAYTSTSSGWTFTSVAGVFDGGYHAKVNVYGTTCKYWLVTPATYINIGNAQLTFDLALTDYGNADPIEDPTAQLDDKFVVLVKQEVDTNWTILRQWDNAGSTYVYNDIATAGQQVTIDLGAYNGHAIQIAFYAESTVAGGDNDLRIDNVLIDRVPDCAGPSNFKIVPGSVSKNSAQLSWDANSGETSWIVQYKKSSVNAWISVNATSNPYTLTGLNDSTAYDVRVAAYCDPTDPTALSAFTKYISFQTAIEAPYEQGFKSLPGDWKRYTALLDSLWMGEDSLKAVTTGWTVGTGNGVFGNNHLKLTISGTTTRNWIVSPFISVGDEMQLSFDMALTKSTGTTPTAVDLGAQPDDKFAVLITDDGGATWTDLQIWDNTSAAESFDLINSTKDGQTKTYDLTAYAGQTIAIAFYGESTVSNTSSIIHVDNVSIDSIPGCTAPTDVTVSDISDTSAVITWFEELGANWEYCLLMTTKADSIPAESAYISTTAHSVVLDTLSEVSDYVFLVRKNCGSVYSEPVVRTIKTLKSPYKIPFEEDFEAGKIPADWTMYTGLLSTVMAGTPPTAATSGWNFGSGNNVLGNHARSNIYGNYQRWLVTPEINLAGTTAQVSFDLALTVYSSTSSAAPTAGGQPDDKFDVLISTNRGATWEILREWNNSGSQYVYDGISNAATGDHIVLNISNYAGQNVMIAFYGESTISNGDNNIHVDNVVVESIPTCLKPTDLTVSDITAAGATFTWAPVDSANWQYCALANAAKDSIPEDAAFISTTADSITLSNLEQQTNYVFFLRKDCGAEDGYSSIVTASFQTSQLPVNLPFADDFEGANNWLLINGELTNHWMIGTGAHKDGAKALYITDDDSLNHYSNSAAIVYATKAIQIQNDSDMYSVKLDWKGWGESTYDYLRAAIVPASVTLEAATAVPTGFAAAALPAGWIAADGGSKLNLDSAKWSTSAAELMIPKAGIYNIVLAWRNDLSGGAQPPIAVDNFSMQRISCPKPTGLAVSKISSDSAKVSWKYQEGANYEYCLIATKNVDTIPAANAFLPVSADTSVMVLKSLTQMTDYVFFLRKNCGENDLSDYISIAFTTKQTPIDIDPIFEDDFEDVNNWVFINGEIENHWIIDTAAHNGSGEKAMYITNDDSLNVYTFNKAAMVYATKAFNFEKGSYIFQYDWRAAGRTSYSTKYDYLRVALVPYEAELVAGIAVPTGFGPKALPTGCIALDGGVALNEQPQWQTVTTGEIAIENAGAYMLVFAWRNSTSTSGAANPPAAIDNVSITKLSCPAPSNVIIPDSSRTASSATIYWSAADTAQHKWEIAYDTIALFNPDTVSNPIVVMDTLAYSFSGLDENTTYYVYVHAVCSETSESDWSAKASFSTTSACETPAALVAKDVTYHSALINWNAYGLDTFNIRYASATDTVWTEVLNVTRPFAIDSLEPATLYGVQVQPACNDTVWSEALTFKTGYLMPLLEEFPTTTIPTDWSRYYGWLDDVMDGTADLTATTSYWVFGSNNGVFDSHARLNIYGTSCNRWLVTPAVHVEGNVQLTFDMALTKYSGTLAPVDSTQQLDDKFVVLVSENGGESWTILRQWDNAGSEYVYNKIVCSADGQPVAINLSAYSGKDIKIAFYGESTLTGGDNNLHIDNVLIDEIPSCIKPTGLKVLGVEATTAKFAWNAEEGAVWQYAYLADAAIDSIPADAAFASLDTNYVELSALIPMTNYVFFLRRNCGEVDGYSKIIAKAFTTKQLAVELPFTDDFENGNSWLLYNGELENAWAWGTATNNGGTHALYISNDGGESNAYTNNKAAVVYATKRIHIEEDGQYIFSYDWMANGESTYDYLRVALVPDSIASFEASTSIPTGLSTTSLPTGWIALDGASKLNLSTAWANKSVTKQLNAGLYQLVLLWRDDTSGGTNPPAAIDNVSVIQKLCVTPTDLNATVTTTSATLSWTSEAEAWQLVYSENADFNPDSVSAINLSANSYVLVGLSAETTYYFAVRTNCGDNFFSDWSAISSFTTASPCVPTHEIIYDTICPGETITFGDTILSEAGTYVDSLINVAGCDSIVTLELSVYASEATIYAFDSIGVNDLPYEYEAPYITDQLPIHYDLGTAPGTYTDSALVHGEHCPVMLVLTVKITEAQGINNINGGDGKHVQKLIYHDVLYIIVDDEWYNANGQKVADPRD